MENTPYISLQCLSPEEGLLQVRDEIVDTCITSLPLFDYRKERPECYVNRLADIFDSVRRTLTAGGTLWVHAADTFARSGDREGAWKRKDLLGLPWMVAFELRHRGWYLRQDIIWNRLNCVPESVKDRCTRSYDHIFMFAKNSKYTYNRNAIREFGKTEKWRNRRDVWTLNMPERAAYAGHSLPPQAIANIMRAATLDAGIVLDPFVGFGNVALVAYKLGRSLLGFEEDKKKCAIVKQRLQNENLIITELNSEE